MADTQQDDQDELSSNCSTLSDYNLEALGDIPNIEEIQTHPIETHAGEEKATVPELKQDTFLGQSMTRRWLAAFNALTCSRTSGCKVPTHRKKGIFSDTHTALAPQTKYSILWGLTMTLTYAEGKARKCFPCAQQGKNTMGNIPYMLRHTCEEHGSELQESESETELIASLRALRALQEEFFLSCPMRDCTALCGSAIELYIHFTIDHSSWSTSHLVMCMWCMAPLHETSIEVHCKQKGALHNRGCCDSRWDTLQEFLNHFLNTHTIEFLSQLTPALREKLLEEIYHNNVTVAWAKAAPLILCESMLPIGHSELLPDVLDASYTQTQELDTPLSLVRLILDRGNRANLAFSYLDTKTFLSARETQTIIHEIGEQLVVQKLNTLLSDIEKRTGNDWVKEHTGFSLESRLTAHRSRAWCGQCKDTSNHSTDPSDCYDRLAAESIAGLMVQLDIPQLVPENDNLLIGSGRGLFNIAPTGASKWTNLSATSEFGQYCQLWTPNGRRLADGAPSTFQQDYLYHIRRILALAKPGPHTPIIVDFFPMTNQLDKEIDLEKLYLEAQSFLVLISELSQNNLQFYIFLPLPTWQPGQSTTDYLRSLKLSKEVGAIVTSLAAKVRLTVIPTVGILEALPITDHENFVTHWYPAAASKADLPVKLTRNLLGSTTREFQRRYSVLMDIIADAAHQTKIMINSWEEMRSLRNVHSRRRENPSYITDLFPSATELNEEDVYMDV